jgi:hypothetical protein
VAHQERPEDVEQVRRGLGRQRILGVDAIPLIYVLLEAGIQDVFQHLANDAIRTGAVASVVVTALMRCRSLRLVYSWRRANWSAKDSTTRHSTPWLAMPIS